MAITKLFVLHAVITKIFVLHTHRKMSNFCDIYNFSKQQNKDFQKGHIKITEGILISQ